MKSLVFLIAASAMIPFFGHAQAAQNDLIKPVIVAQASTLQAQYNQLTGSTSTINFASFKNSFDLADILGVISSKALSYSLKSGGSISTAAKVELLQLQIKLDRLTADVRSYGVDHLLVDGNFPN